MFSSLAFVRYVFILCVLFWFSVGLYVIFVKWYLPRVNLRIPIDLIYTPHGIEANVDFNDCRGFSTSQSYRLFVEFILPQTSSNFELGNFMFEICEASSNQEYILRKSILFPLHSRFVIYSKYALFFPLYLTGFWDESVLYKHCLASKFRIKPTKLLYIVKMSQAKLKIYNCTLLLEARLNGIQKVLHLYPLLASFFAISSIFLSAICFFGLLKFALHIYRQSYHEMSAMNILSSASLSNNIDFKSAMQSNALYQSEADIRDDEGWNLSNDISDEETLISTANKRSGRNESQNDLALVSTVDRQGSETPEDDNLYLERLFSYPSPN